jgi:hypothetical protein
MDIPEDPMAARLSWRGFGDFFSEFVAAKMHFG